MRDRFLGSGRDSLVAEVEGWPPLQGPPADEHQQIVAGSLRIDLAARLALLGETPLDLTAREFDLLCHFARHPGWVYSRRELLEQVWGYEYGDPQIVTVHIANLRKKVKAVAPGYQLIQTVQSVGYRLAAAPATLPVKGSAVASRPFSAAGLGLRWSRFPQHKRTRIIVGSAFAAAAVLIGLGLGLGLGLRGEDPATLDPGAKNAGGGTMGIGPELISQTKDYSDVSGDIPEGKFLVTAGEASQYNEGTYIVVDPSTIWPSLQGSFQLEQSDIAAEGDLCILWVGDQNRGYVMNAAVTNRLFIPEGLEEDDGYKRNFIGALPHSIPKETGDYYVRGDLFAEVGVETPLPGIASGVLVSLIPVANPEEPDTRDHYVEVHVPFLDETFYARISLDEWGPIFGEYLSTRVECLDLRTNFQTVRPYEWHVGQYWLRTLLFTYGVDLSGIMRPGDWVILSFSLDKSLAAPFVDYRGVQYINHITVQRFEDRAFRSVRDLLYPSSEPEMGTQYP